MTLLAAKLWLGLEIYCAPYAHAETQIIPSITASERYDSNVWRGPASFLPPGTKAWDFVTSLSPQVEIANKSALGDTKFNAGVGGNLFVNNPELNFISTNVGLNSDLTGWIRELIPGARLRVTESFFYTPEPPGFVTGVKPQDPSDAFARGVVAFRANTFTNYATVTGSYAFTRSLGIQASYSNSIFRVGQIFQPEPTAAVQTFYFNSMVNSGSVGPRYRLTRTDTIGLSYQPTFISVSGGGSETGPSSLAAHAMLAEYTREVRDWTVTVEGGPAFLEQSDRLYYNGRVTIFTYYDPATTVRFSASRDISPGFYGVSGALVSNTVGLSIERKLARELLLAATANYSYNTAVPVEIYKFESVLAGLRLTYQLTRTLSTAISYDYNNFRTVSGTGAALQSFEFDRHAITFSIASKWK